MNKNDNKKKEKEIILQIQEEFFNEDKWNNFSPCLIPKVHMFSFNSNLNWSIQMNILSAAALTNAVAILLW